MNFDANIIRGDTIEFVVSLTINKIKQDLTGATIYYTIKKNKEDTDPVISKEYIGAGTEVLVEASSNSLQSGRYIQEVRINLATGTSIATQGVLSVDEWVKEA